jgi:hypothetical protein
MEANLRDKLYENLRTSTYWINCGYCLGDDRRKKKLQQFLLEYVNVFDKVTHAILDRFETGIGFAFANSVKVFCMY